jgi:hypothetical protein
MKTFRILLVALTTLLTANLALAQTWIQTSAPADTNWISIASSADGSKLVAVANGGIYNIVGILYGTLPGPIYTSTNSGLTWCQKFGSLLHLRLMEANSLRWFNMVGFTPRLIRVQLGRKLPMLPIRPEVPLPPLLTDQN